MYFVSDFDATHILANLCYNPGAIVANLVREATIK